MKRITLSLEEKSQLERRHKACRDKRECDRINVLLCCEGWTVPMISQALRIHETSVSRHINDYNDNKLKPENGGSQSALNQEETVKLIEHFENHTYHYVHEMIEYIKQCYGVSYSVPGMNKWLHRHDFSYKKSKGSKEAILFMDAVHPTQATKLSHGWIRTGKTKNVYT